MRPPRLALALLALVAALALTPAARAQSGFTVTHVENRSAADKVVMQGTVLNENRADALDVSITAEALDARNKVVARGIAYVASRIAPQSRAEFTASIPAVPTATHYRVYVSSFHLGFGLGPQAP